MIAMLVTQRFVNFQQGKDFAVEVQLYPALGQPDIREARHTFIVSPQGQIDSDTEFGILPILPNRLLSGQAVIASEGESAPGYSSAVAGQVGLLTPYRMRAAQDHESGGDVAAVVIRFKEMGAVAQNATLTPVLAGIGKDKTFQQFLEASAKGGNS
jgi:hypothetical protein